MGAPNPSIRSILCMVDLSPAAKALIDWSARLAQRTGAELRLLHAIHVPSDLLHPTTEFERSGDLQARRTQCEAAIAALMPPSTVSMQVAIVPGDPVEAVVDYCRGHPIDLIVAGSLGITRLKRLFLGTVVERLARLVPCPVLILRPADRGPGKIGRIGVCCDLSPDHLPLIGWGGRLAHALGASVEVLHAIESPVHVDMIDPATGPYGQVQSQLQQQIDEQLKRMARDEIVPEVAVSTHLATGPAQDELLDRVRGGSVDLVVVGVRHHSAIGKLIVGSTTETLLRKAPCHVLTVPVPFVTTAAAREAGAPPPPTGVVRDPFYLAHRCETEHAENHHRLEEVYALLDRLEPALPLVRIAPRPATEEDLTRVHSAAYVDQIEATARHDHTQLTPDTYACAASFAVASLAAGGVIAAIDTVVAGPVRNAFVLARPPGHHAEAGRANGYCLFNNVAVGARYAREKLGMDKVLIVDWDLHHGNGIQHIFEQDPSVLYFSTHQYPLFPGTGHLLEVGRGRGEGYTINVPLRKGLGDGDIAYLYQRLLVPIAHDFKPDLILVAAGFDIHKKDPLGGMKLTAQGFAALTRIVMQIGDACCQGRLVLVLEGGYHRQSLADSVRAVLEELCDHAQCDVNQVAARFNRRKVDPIVHRCTEVMKRYWSCFNESEVNRKRQDDHG
jgi:acetoin utilization deacetylase AcuC-like enzyme/nucleotide-binding universal stress UspA family protein